MLEEMLPVLPLPTLILLKVSHALHRVLALAAGRVIAAAFGGALVVCASPRARRFGTNSNCACRSSARCSASAALGRFARTLGTLVKSGVSLLPALKIVENTIGNRILARQIARVAEETRGGDSLAAPLRKLGIFPRTVVQMIDVGEETGKLDEMLLKVADIEERHMRARTKTLISLLAPAVDSGRRRDGRFHGHRHFAAHFQDEQRAALKIQPQTQNENPDLTKKHARIHPRRNHGRGRHHRHSGRDDHSAIHRHDAGRQSQRRQSRTSPNSNPPSNGFTSTWTAIPTTEEGLKVLVDPPAGDDAKTMARALHQAASQRSVGQSVSICCSRHASSHEL